MLTPTDFYSYPLAQSLVYNRCSISEWTGEYRLALIMDPFLLDRTGHWLIFVTRVNLIYTCGNSPSFSVSPHPCSWLNYWLAFLLLVLMAPSEVQAFMHVSNFSLSKPYPRMAHNQLQILKLVPARARLECGDRKTLDTCPSADRIHSVGKLGPSASVFGYQSRVP